MKQRSPVGAAPCPKMTIIKARLQVHTQGFSQLEVDVTISHKTDIFCRLFSEKDLHVKLS